jgi:hypothetical protein
LSLGLVQFTGSFVDALPRWCIAAAAARPWMLSAQPLLRG